jgi:hypothetical protein
MGENRGGDKLRECFCCFSFHKNIIKGEVNHGIGP